MNPLRYLVVDLEATCCDKGTVPPDQMEIIELGAVMVSADDYRTVDEFQSFVRPVRHPRLTEFCVRLTSIQQRDVNVAPEFRVVIDAFKSWLYRYTDFYFCSWGSYDLKQLKQDCRFHNVAYPVGAAHKNLKTLFVQRQNLAKKPGLDDALRLVGLDFEGVHHRGIDDARNAGRMLPYVFGTSMLPSGDTSDQSRTARRFLR